MADATQILAPWQASAGTGGNRNSMVVYQGNGIATTFNFNFAGGYIQQAHIKAYIFDDVRKTYTDLVPVFLGPNTLQVVPALTATQYVTIYRDTPKDQPLVDFATGAPLTEPNLDLLAKQAVFVSAELVDRFDTTSGDSKAATAASSVALAQSTTALEQSGTASQNSTNAVQTANTAKGTADAANGKADQALAYTLTGTPAAADNTFTGNNSFTKPVSVPAATAVGHAVRKDQMDAAIAAGGTAKMDKASNLSDLANATTARSNLGLGNVDNTADVNKPVSTPQKTALDAASPAGQVAMFAGSVAPAGWLKANGAALSRATYAALFAAIGTLYGGGDGVSTFNLPDFRGEFPRFTDDGRGVDPGRTVGSAQLQSLKTHTHGGTTDTQGWHDHSTNAGPNNGNFGLQNGGAYFNAAMVNGLNNNRTDGNGSHSHNLSITSTGDGTENRPRNVAVLACIKF